MRRLITPLLALTVAGGMALAVPAGAATAAPSVGAAPTDAAAPLRYVALGDSYSAASGVLPLDLTSPVCLRSTLNYPNLVAQALGAQLTDVTCGAAETKSITAPQYDPFVPAQIDAVKADTQLVTLTIGGNDSSVFFGAIVKCGVLGIASLGQGSPCKDATGSSLDDTVNNVTFPAIVNALKAIRAKAPQARIAILGYPEILPPAVGCFPQMPVASGDVPFLHALQGTLNSAVRRAAAAVPGVTFVDFGEVSVGHDACQVNGARWIEPAVLGTNPVIVHPNALGEAKMAEQTLKVLGMSAPATGNRLKVLTTKAKPTLSAGRKASARVTVRCVSTATTCTGTVRVAQGRTRVATKSVTVKAGAKRTFTVRLTKAATRKLTRDRRAKVTLKATVAGRGATASSTGPATVVVRR